MKRVLIIILALVVVGALAAGGWWYFTANPEAASELLAELGLASTESAAAGVLTGSGTIEAEEVIVSAELGGKVVEITVDEGDEVRKGEVLVRLDRELLLAQKRQAEAAVERAAAELAKVQAGPRGEDIRQAQANLAVAEAGLQQARQSLSDAARLRDNPQELDAEIDAARADVEVAQKDLAAAQTGTQAAQASYDMLERQWRDLEYFIRHNLHFTVNVPGPGGQMVERTVIVGPGPADLDPLSQQWNQSGGQLMLAWDAVALSQANLDGAQRHLAMLEEMRANPLQAQAQVNAAAQQVKVAESEVSGARANLALLKAGAREEQVAMARAQLRRAEAAVQVIEAQLDKTVLTAPRDGLVMERSVNSGEMATPGATLLTLADLDRVKLKVYIPEDQIGKVKIGQKVLVQVDSYPGKDYQGAVTYISSEAEFTPKNVQTKEDRVSTVFAVKVSLDNANHELKPGMPADAELETGG
jgi:HlyD family secretion protein